VLFGGLDPGAVVKVVVHRNCDILHCFTVIKWDGRVKGRGAWDAEADHDASLRAPKGEAIGSPASDPRQSELAYFHGLYYVVV
jgi:hypothetical protein